MKPSLLIPIVLAGWVVLTIRLFGKRPGREAALLSLVGGWAVLPNSLYPPSVLFEPVGIGGTMHALALPTPLWLNKALAIGLGCLLGVVLFDWPAARRLRPVWLDAPILAWCVVPIASALAAGRPLAEGLAQTRYLALAWGVPYLVGRLYFGGNESLRHLAVALVLGGLLYVPLGLLEFVHGPFLYGLLYGPHPYQTEGASRFAGHRPLVFLEHGNQLGMWIASAAVAAAWLWWSGRMEALARVPGRVVAGILIAACVLFQSHGALLLALAGLAPLLLVRLSFLVRRPAHAALASGLLLLLALAATAAVVAAEGGNGTALRYKVRGVFRSIGKTSFTWRLARSEEDLPRIAQRPLLGWSRPDWSAAPDGTFVNPVNLGLWLVTVGTFGAVGLTCMAAVLVLPVVRVVRGLPPAQWTQGAHSALALTALLLIMALVDSLLNSVLLLPLLAGAGGISSWSAGGETGVRPRPGRAQRRP